MQSTSPIEWEPEYLEDFWAYIRTKIASSFVPYCLDLEWYFINTGGREKVPGDMKDRTLKSLKRLEEDLECMRNPEKPKTVTYSFLKKILPEETIKKMPDNVGRAMAILGGGEPLTQVSYWELTDYFQHVFEELTEKCQDLETKVMGPSRFLRTYYPEDYRV